MAFAHLHFNDQNQYGRILRRALSQNEDADQLLKETLDLMATMIDGDGSLDAHYTEVTVRFGFTSDAQSHAAYTETLSCSAKTSGNASVTNVRAARDQWFSKLRG